MSSRIVDNMTSMTNQISDKEQIVLILPAGAEIEGKVYFLFTKNDGN